MKDKKAQKHRIETMETGGRKNDGRFNGTVYTLTDNGMNKTQHEPFSYPIDD